MRIKEFSTVVHKYLSPLILDNKTVVVDGQNVCYDLYKYSEIPYIFGAESDVFAKYLRNYFRMFLDANVKCYFIFKGGHEEISKRILKPNCADSTAQKFDLHKTKRYVAPIFMKEIYKQVMDEMGIMYSVCEFEAKKEVIAFAQKHQISIISQDIEFAFSGVPYIPVHSIKVNYDKGESKLTCGVFILDNFIQKFSLNEDKLALFIALTDESDYFPLTFFNNFIKSKNIPVFNNYKRNIGILNWLKIMQFSRSLDEILKYMNDDTDKDHFINRAVKNARKLIRRKEAPGLVTTYLENKNAINFDEHDPLWFEKGVACGHISIPLINLARSTTLFGSWAIEDKEADDALLLSIDIAKYCCNLLTNFNKATIKFISKEQQHIININDSVPKPDFGEKNGPFENGWDSVNKELFHYFLNESLQGFDFESLNKVSEDTRLLMLALVYYSAKKTENTTCEVYSILLSHIALRMNLNILCESNNNNTEFHGGIKITFEDKSRARDMLAQYFKTDDDELMNIFDRKLLHPLVEFQHCLFYMNCLNKLCGKPFLSTVYSRTYNGTFVYQTMFEMKTKYDGDGLIFLKNTLISVPTVLQAIEGLIEVYNEITNI